MKRTLLLILFSLFLVPSVWATPDANENVSEQVRGVDSTSKGFVAKVLHWYDDNMSYWAVGGLMAIESSFIPFPSEVVIPPAVYLASDPQSKTDMKVWLIVLFGTLGAMVGALINYYLAYWLGRPVLYAFADSKLGRLLMLSSEKMKKAEDYFNKYGNASTFFGRLVPAVRQLISIPAGLARMSMGGFLFFTFLGAGLWNVVLAVLGYLAYQAADLSVIEQYSHVLSYVLIGLVALFIVVFVVLKIVKTQKKKRNGV